MREIDVVHVGERSGLRYAHLRPEWGEEVEQVELACYPTADPDDLYNALRLRWLACDFPDGCFAGFDGDRIVAAGLGLRTTFDFDHPVHTIDDIVPPDDRSSGHVPDGEWYYGTGIATHPEYRRRGIGSELYELRKQVCRNLGLRGIVAGGVLPGFAEHKHAMSADEYIVEVREGRLYDPTLTFQIEHGFEAICGLPDYISDTATDGWAALIVWYNPEHPSTASGAPTA